MNTLFNIFSDYDRTKQFYPLSENGKQNKQYKYQVSKLRRNDLGLQDTPIENELRVLHQKTTRSNADFHAVHPNEFAKVPPSIQYLDTPTLLSSSQRLRNPKSCENIMETSFQRYSPPDHFKVDYHPRIPQLAITRFTGRHKTIDDFTNQYYSLKNTTKDPQPQALPGI